MKVCRPWRAVEGGVYDIGALLYYKAQCRKSESDGKQTQRLVFGDMSAKLQNMCLRVVRDYPN